MMPAAINNGVSLYFEDSGGSGTPVLFLHEYAGDHRSWAGQVAALNGGYRCIAVCARGYPPSDFPNDPAAYSQALMNDDVLAVLDAVGVRKAHIVGLSMGAFTALQLAQFHPERVLSVTAAAGGSGSSQDIAAREGFVTEALGLAAMMEKQRTIPAEAMCKGPTRIQLRGKDEAAWQMSVDHLASHPWQAAAHMLRGVQVGRPSLRDQEQYLAAVKLPVLLLVGDEDTSCLHVNIWLKQIMPSARLMVFSASGHAVNLEEPSLFNQQLENFLELVEAGVWQPRDPRTMPKAGVHTALGLGGDIRD
jgi:pimeloyl-ACP methyl ester carboxylesterase